MITVGPLKLVSQGQDTGWCKTHVLAGASSTLPTSSLSGSLRTRTGGPSCTTDYALTYVCTAPGSTWQCTSSSASQKSGIPLDISRLQVQTARGVCSVCYADCEDFAKHLLFPSFSRCTNTWRAQRDPSIPTSQCGLLQVWTRKCLHIHTTPTGIKSGAASFSSDRAK